MTYYIGLYRNEEGRWMGRTNGCGCCADSEQLEVNQVREHVAGLREEADELERAISGVNAENLSPPHGCRGGRRLASPWKLW